MASEEEAEQLAGELADGLIGYLFVDTSDSRRKTEESIEDCLNILEEVCSVLENYKQNSEEIGDIVGLMSNKIDTLNKLYEQIDNLNQYIFEANRSLDQLETLMKELENHKNNSRIKHISSYVTNIIGSTFSNIINTSRHLNF